ncbi:Protein CapL [Desulfovibrionales bacterium]
MVTLDSLFARQSYIVVVGLGYVGLPLSLALARHFDVIGLDIAEERVAELTQGCDCTSEVGSDTLAAAAIRYTTDPAVLVNAGVVIVAVSTPLDEFRRPDLTPLVSATTTVGRHMVSGTVVVFESTVWPGLTEEICVPLLEKYSGLAGSRDFFVGYSPERINPGDRVHTLERVVKVVAGQDQATLDLLSGIYGAIIEAGVYRASSIKVAEAAKVIENTQRDLNIALMNELSLIFDLMGIDTLEVIGAAASKWNFIPFTPGLVGGHCIGVDPYYLTFKAESLGYHPQVILAGRRINDAMAHHVAQQAVKMIACAGGRVSGGCVGILGFTFKENVPDLRNTKVIDVVHELAEYGIKSLVHDAYAMAKEAHREYGIDLLSLDCFRNLDALIVAVPHREYASLALDTLASWFRNPTRPILLDLRGLYSPNTLQAAGFTSWRL